MREREARGVGIGFRPQLAAAMFRSPERVDFVEVVAEACRDRRARREAVAISEVWPVVPHGVKLSLGSAEGIDDERARALGDLARDLRAPFVSEHVSFVRADGSEIGHLTELPMTRASVRAVARNVATLRRHLPDDLPLLLENVARSFVWSDAAHEMSEGDFYQEIVHATGCELLLDVANLYANALNSDVDAAKLLHQFPLDRVRMVHVAGGVLENGFYFDTHAHPVPEAVFDLVKQILKRRPDAAVMLERDATFENVSSIFEEVDRLRSIANGATHKSNELTTDDDVRLEDEEEAPITLRSSLMQVRGPASNEDDAESEMLQLAVDQAMLAERLIACDDDNDAIVRARSILTRKRAEDVRHLLPSLGTRLTFDEIVALGKIAESPRAATMTALHDAMRVVAHASSTRPELASEAARDRLSLRARFARFAPGGAVLPWIGREVLADGTTFWALKGFGPSSHVRVFERP